MPASTLTKYDQLKHYGETAQRIAAAADLWITTGIWMDPVSSTKDSTLAGLYQVRKAAQEAAAKRNMPFIVANRKVSFGTDFTVLQVPVQKRTEKVRAHFILLCESCERDPSAHQIAQKPYMRNTAQTSHIYISGKHWDELINPLVSSANWRQLMRLT